MTTYRRYMWHCDPDKTDRALLLLRRVVEEMPQFFRDLEVTGQAFGLSELSITICDRDIWWVGRRARLLTEDLWKLAGVQLANEHKVKLPPHNHPNRAARWKGKIDGPDADRSDHSLPVHVDHSSEPGPEGS